MLNHLVVIPNLETMASGCIRSTFTQLSSPGLEHQEFQPVKVEVFHGVPGVLHCQSSDTISAVWCSEH